MNSMFQSPFICKFGHVFLVMIFLQSPLISFSFNLISSSWQETMLTNCAEQVGVEISSEAINTLFEKQSQTFTFIRFFTVRTTFLFPGKMLNVPFQWIQMYSSLIRDNDLTPVYIQSTVAYYIDDFLSKVVLMYVD